MADSAAPRIRPRSADSTQSASSESASRESASRESASRESASTEPDGFSAALAAAAPTLRTFFRNRTRTARDAEDLEQETLERAWRYRQSFEHSLEITPWLRRCAMNVWLAWRKRESRRPELLGETASGIADPRGGATEARDSLAAALAPLADIQRELLLRHHRDRLKVHELAAEFGLPENTVKSHLRRARARLARIDDDE